MVEKSQPFLRKQVEGVADILRVVCNSEEAYHAPFNDVRYDLAVELGLVSVDYVQPDNDDAHDGYASVSVTDEGRRVYGALQ